MKTTFEAVPSTHDAFVSAFVEIDDRWPTLRLQIDPNREGFVILQS